MRAYRRLMACTVAVYVASVFFSAARVAWPDLSGVPGSVLAWTAAAEQVALARTGSPRPSCRVYLVGSSPVLFGLSAVAISQKTGCVVVNAAQSHFQDKLTPYLTAVLDQVHPGDVVVLVDRRWTNLPHMPDACDATGGLPCMVMSVGWLPDMANEWRNARQDASLRGPSGDLTSYAEPAMGHGSAETGPLLDLQRRVDSASAAAAAIRRRDAIPVLYGVPIHVREEDQPVLTLEFSELSRMMTLALGAGVWQGTHLLSDRALFLSDAKHLNATGRVLWSDLLAETIMRMRSP